jgi:unsaturated chondroitin disaccharide hydrolase
MKQISTIFLAAVFVVACNNKPADTDVNTALDYCVTQAYKNAEKRCPPIRHRYRRSIANGKTDCVLLATATGHVFLARILWYAYEYTPRRYYKHAAQRYSRALFPLVDSAAIDQ